MHLLWIHQEAWLRGGAERYVHETASRLAALGVRSTLLYDVTTRVDPSFVAPFEGAYPLVDVAMQLRALAPDAVYVHRVADEAALSLVRSATAAPIVRFFHDHKLFCLREHKTTVLHGTACTKVASASNCYPCMGFVQRSSGILPLRLVSASSLRRARAHSEALDGYVVASEYMAREVAAHGLARQRVHVLPLAAHEVSGRSRDVTREAGHVLFVGALVRGKGVDVLLQAAARSRAIRRLTLVGDGAQRAELVAEAARLGVTDRVTFTGHLDRGALEDAYARAAIVVVPSRVPETFGLAGLEASARGLPVIASDVGGVRAWLEPERTGLLVPAGDVSALEHALGRLLADGALCARLGSEGERRARECFSAAAHDSALLAIFERLLTARAA